MEDINIIQSYVWYNGECFFVSTANRESSVVNAPGVYAETLVWRYDRATRVKSRQILYQSEDTKGSITTHIGVCTMLNLGGVDALLFKEE